MRRRAVWMNNTIVVWFLFISSKAPRMREIVDKFFPDNWVVDVYMGKTVNLVEAWESFRAARQALANNLEPRYVKDVAVGRGRAVPELVAQTQSRLRQGHLTSELILDDSHRLLNLIRDCNVALRWMILHATSASSKVAKCGQLRDNVARDAGYSPGSLLALLLDTAELELKVREAYKVRDTSRKYF